MLSRCTFTKKKDRLNFRKPSLCSAGKKNMMAGRMASHQTVTVIRAWARTGKRRASAEAADADARKRQACAASAGGWCEPEAATVLVGNCGRLAALCTATRPKRTVSMAHEIIVYETMGHAPIVRNM
jgi:hypothetical protein